MCVRCYFLPAASNYKKQVSLERTCEFASRGEMKWSPEIRVFQCCKSFQTADNKGCDFQKALSYEDQRISRFMLVL